MRKTSLGFCDAAAWRNTGFVDNDDDCDGTNAAINPAVRY